MEAELAQSAQHKTTEERLNMLEQKNLADQDQKAQQEGCISGQEEIVHKQGP
jgi:hypothetical protein